MDKCKEKLTVAVIFGGCSPEHDVSLASAACVLSNLDRSRYHAVPVGITREGQWFWFQGDIEKIENDTWYSHVDCVPAVLSPDRKDHGLLVERKKDMCRIYLDAAFPVLHGKNGEDGTVQGLLELAGIPVVGCGLLSSAVCMDKDKAHRLAASAGVGVAASFVCTGDDKLSEVEEKAAAIGYPLFVKPVHAGSSYGISQVLEIGQLKEALELALQYDGQVILEESIFGVEVGCSVLGNHQLIAGVADEIELKEGFLDLGQKYGERTAVIHVPARISREKEQEIRQAAMTVYRALGCRGFARVDLFLTPSGRILFNEVNTIPGMTCHSRFPNMLKAAGISLEQMVSKVIQLAMEN